MADHHQDQDDQRLKHADDGLVGVAEQDRGGFDADLEVVVPVDHGVEGVVGHRPEYVGGEQQPGQLAQFAGFRRPGHGNGP